MAASIALGRCKDARAPPFNTRANVYPWCQRVAGGRCVSVLGVSWAGWAGGTLVVRRFFFSAALVCFLMVCFMPLSKPDGSAARLMARLALPVRGCHGSGRLASG